MATKAELEEQLIDEIGAFANDPLGFVLFAFPWGEGELAKHPGPDEWQIDLLRSIGEGLITATEAIQIAISSGHGIGKSAFVSWLILWAVATFEDTRGVVTANTDTQLRTKTWPELMKWHRLCICEHWFTVTATAIFSKQPAHEKTWRVDMVPWSETNTEAFAGLHNQGKRILVIFDEGSAIADKIWEVTEGALTDEDTQIIWFVAGNPTRNTGRFRECFGRMKHRWLRRQIDSRTVRMTNKRQLAKWVEDHGEDSDFVRVRIRGVFPRAGTMQFISSELVEQAQKREAVAGLHDPFIIGVDVARFGDDRSVIAFRKGRDARTTKWIECRGLDNMQLAARVAVEFDRYRADGVFVDEGGNGGGVVDRLRQLGYPVIGVQFGSKADRSMPGTELVTYFNKRAEMWGEMKEWLKGGAIPDDIELEQDLIGPEYSFKLLEGKDAILLESKKDMKDRGLASPDAGDALALTFAYPVMPRADAGRAGYPGGVQRGHAATDYDPYAEAHTNQVQTDYDPYN
ncbi:hypothetical protein B0G81_6798 [Paraburkholderia sp. BL6665CI2N2]|uniref:terminase n=1 Tax=Paraburkholderia sp. BL6665CI2N2 TaxID=1938806 RepID=UPI00106662E9|nr:terminase [Paraburkholderia sp. BL6665CI2N2]TDY26288.1 hypothetical protein B0G81_6798 [Paraburkholderia sp. BL6665CI2N2]